MTKMFSQVLKLLQSIILKGKKVKCLPRGIQAAAKNDCITETIAKHVYTAISKSRWTILSSYSCQSRLAQSERNVVF